MTREEQALALIASVKTLTDLLMDSENKRDYYRSKFEYLDKRYNDTYAKLQDKDQEIRMLKQKIEDLLAKRSVE